MNKNIISKSFYSNKTKSTIRIHEFTFKIIIIFFILFK